MVRDFAHTVGRGSFVRVFSMYEHSFTCFRICRTERASNGIPHSHCRELLDSHALLHAQQQIACSFSPSFFSRHVGRKWSSSGPPGPDPTKQLVYKQLAPTFYIINSNYRITWQFVELLIELGGGSTGPGPPTPTTSVSAPVGVHVNVDEGSSLTRRKGRERAITLAGDEPNLLLRCLVYTVR
jgi:hypothetical protein